MDIAKKGQENIQNPSPVVNARADAILMAGKDQAAVLQGAGGEPGDAPPLAESGTGLDTVRWSGGMKPEESR